MDKVLVRLGVPAVGGDYEVFIPKDIYVEDLRRLLASSVEDITNGQYVSSGSEFLCLKERGQVMREKEQAVFYKIANGERLMLM